MIYFQSIIIFIFEIFKYYVQSDYFPPMFYMVLVAVVFVGLVKVVRSMK